MAWSMGVYWDGRRCILVVTEIKFPSADEMTVGRKNSYADRKILEIGTYDYMMGS
jgi:hypothetical protein